LPEPRTKFVYNSTPAVFILIKIVFSPQKEPKSTPYGRSTPLQLAASNKTSLISKRFAIHALLLGVFQSDPDARNQRFGAPGSLNPFISYIGHIENSSKLSRC
jgi:hypothetical protein